MELNKNNVKKILGIITFTLVLLALLLNLGAVKSYMMFLWGIVFPFIMGGAIAFILNIPMTAIEKKLFGGKAKAGNFETASGRGEAEQEREQTGDLKTASEPEKAVPQSKLAKIKRKLARPVSLILSILFVLAIITVVLVVVIPQLGKTIDSVSAGMTEFWPKAQKWLEEMFGDRKEIMDYINSLEFDWQGWLNQIKDFALSGAGNVISYTMNATMMVISGVMTFFIAFIFSLYVLIQKENLGGQCRKVIHAVFPEKVVDKICYICSLSHRTFSRFITGQCLEALILGTMFFISMTIFRLPYALLVGVLIAFTALIPIVGAFIGCFVGAFLILMVNPMQAVFFVILFLVLQQIEGNLIYPHVVGNSVGLPSIWVLFAVTVGGKLFGIAGMLMFIPLMSVLYTLFREWVNKRSAAREK